MPSISFARLVLLSTALLLAGACGSATNDDAPVADGSTDADTESDESADDNDGFPVTVPSEDGEITLDAPPQAVVSLSPSSTELLYAIGAGDQVVAVDRHSNHPEGTPTTDLSNVDPNVEAVADLGPDLVVTANDNNDIVDGLGALDIPVLVHPSATSIDDTFEQARSLGRSTGQTDAAEALVDDLETRLDELEAVAGDEAEGLTYYHELSEGYFTATSETFVGELYGLLGLENIADEAPEAGAAGGYPQIAPELVVEADPDLIFVTYPDADLEQRSGWTELTAVREGHVVELDPDIASRWGPRIVEQVETVLEAVTARLEAADNR